jgi:hypothetical protein
MSEMLIKAKKVETKRAPVTKTSTEFVAYKYEKEIHKSRTA